MIADILLSGVVQCVQELVKLIIGLATEYRQQLLILSERYHFRVNGIPLLSTKNLGLIKFHNKTGMFGIQGVHQEHVMLTDNLRVNKSVIEI